MDIESLIYEDTSDMKVTDHTGNEMINESGDIMSITFYSEDTDERLRAYQRYRRNMMEAGKDIEEQLTAECKLLADLTHKFNHVIYEGKEVTLKDAFNVYRNIHKIRNDALEFVGDTGNFIKGHSKN